MQVCKIGPALSGNHLLTQTTLIDKTKGLGVEFCVNSCFNKYYPQHTKLSHFLPVLSLESLYKGFGEGSGQIYCEMLGLVKDLVCFPFLWPALPCPYERSGLLPKLTTCSPALLGIRPINNE